MRNGRINSPQEGLAEGFWQVLGVTADYQLVPVGLQQAQIRRKL
jgi:hypothetical protein